MDCSYTTRLVLECFSVTILSLTVNFSHASDLIPEPRITEPYLYEVTHPDLEEASYLFGSFHYGVSTSELPSWVIRLHNNASSNIYEMDVASVGDYRLLQDLYRNPQEILNKGYPRNSERVIKILEEIGIEESLAPYFLVGSCGWSAYYNTFVYKQIWSSLDGELMINTKLNGRPFVELETEKIREDANKMLPPEEQAEECKFIDKLDDPAMAKFFLDLVEDGLREGVQEYRAGADSYSGKTEDDEYDMIFRNNAWMPTLISEFAKGNSFAVVGINHLFGNKGLVSLLEQQGYIVKRLKYDPKPSDKWIQWRR